METEKDIKGQTEEQFWEKLQNMTKDDQEYFFHQARDLSSTGKNMSMIILGMIGFGVLTWALGGC